MATVNIHYLLGALRCAERQGMTLDGLLAEIGVSRQQLIQPHTRVHGDQMTRLVQLIWARLGDEFMGCTEHPCKPGVFALMTRYVLHYESLEAILRRGIHFYNLFTDDIQMTLSPQGDKVVLEIVFRRPELDPDHFYQEFWMVIWHRFASWVIGKKIPLIQASFPYGKPFYHSELKYLFPCPHYFNRALLKLSFSADFLVLPAVRTQRDLTLFLKQSPADLITIPGEENSYRGRIRSLLLHQDSEVLHCPSLEQLALSFHISSQTLRRKLNSEGTSYPQIKEEIRHDLAIEKLIVQKLTVSEVGRVLGYSEPRSFTRAFRQWTGMSPTEYCRFRR